MSERFKPEFIDNITGTWLYSFYFLMSTSFFFSVSLRLKTRSPIFPNTKRWLASSVECCRRLGFGFLHRNDAPTRTQITHHRRSLYSVGSARATHFTQSGQVRLLPELLRCVTNLTESNGFERGMKRLRESWTVQERFWILPHPRFCIRMYRISFESPRFQWISRFLTISWDFLILGNIET